MSYAGPSRNRGSTLSTSIPSTGGASPSGRSPLAAPIPRHETDWQQVALFGTGLALGIAVGAGAALLAAPQSGAETRAALMARAARVRRTTSRRGRDAWEDLRLELNGVKRALRRRKLKRAAERDLRRQLDEEIALD
jgi:gas vesicle protein